MIKDSQPKILVLDDEQLMLESVEAILEAYQYNCTLVNSGIEALELLKQHNFDILLLDLMMPAMSGHTVMEIMKESFPDVSIIVISGDATFNNATNALRQGAKDFLAKPYKPEDLIKSIRHIHETRELEHELRHVQQQIKSSEQRYRFFINHSPDVIFVLDKKGKFTFANERITESLNYSQEELLGKPFLQLIYAEDVPKYKYIQSQAEQFQDKKQSTEIRLIKNNTLDKELCFELDFIAINQISFNLPQNQISIDSNSTEQNNNPEQVFSGFYGIARDITEKKFFEQKVSSQLYYDNLTNLPNRVLFIDRINYALSQAKRNNGKLAVLSLDIDRFKTINDSLGHACGDQLLHIVAEKLTNCLRASDTLARVGGNEFLILIPEYNQKEDVEHLLSKIEAAFVAPVQGKSHEIFVSFSIGVSLYPKHAQQPDVLLKYANMAMFQSKQLHTGSHLFFSEQLIHQFKPNLSIENGIRKAITENQFEVYFQPQININTSKISGVEALIRWNHPEQGMIMPDRFIPTAEETTLICDIGNWMINASMKIMNQWNKTPELQGITLAINISAIHFNQKDFCERVLAYMDQYELKGEQIELEITENVLLDDIELVVAKLKILGEYGIKFAIDDFGMGYSSLSYLQELPLNNLKIDRSFISPIQTSDDSNSIVTAIVSMAKEMNMEIVVEGVENDIQLNYVQSLGCPIVQGYYFAKPMSSSDAKQFALAQKV